MTQRLIEGQALTRRDISVLFGGNARAFLPRLSTGEIVAGCFDPDMNPRAPYEALVHNAPNAILAAKRLLEQSAAGHTDPLKTAKNQPRTAAFEIPQSALRIPHSIPVFLRRAPNVWEFVGRYRAVRYSEDPNEVSIRIYEIRPRVYERHVRDYGQIRGILSLDEA